MLGNFGGGFGGPYVFSPSSTKHKYRVIKMKNEKKNAYTDKLIQ